jgi:hypothetical protein
MPRLRAPPHLSLPSLSLNFQPSPRPSTYIDTRHFLCNHSLKSQPLQLLKKLFPSAQHMICIANSPQSAIGQNLFQPALSLKQWHAQKITAPGNCQVRSLLTTSAEATRKQREWEDSSHLPPGSPAQQKTQSRVLVLTAMDALPNYFRPLHLEANRANTISSTLRP